MQALKEYFFVVKALRQKFLKRAVIFFVDLHEITIKFLIN